MNLIEIITVLITVIGGMITSFIAYHRYMITLLDKKMDKDDCKIQQELLAEKRNNLELLITERTKTIFEQQKEMKEDIRIIKEYITDK